MMLQRPLPAHGEHVLIDGAVDDLNPPFAEGGVEGGTEILRRSDAAALRPERGRQRRKVGITEVGATVPPAEYVPLGMAEGAVTSSLITDPPDVQAFTIGKIQCPDAKVKVIDEEGTEVPVGSPGELVYKGPFLFSGYYKDPELTKKGIDEDGFFHSGDQVVLDPSGNIKIVGRLKDIVRRGGEPISPAEIEDLIQGHEKVSEVAGVGMPDKRMVEKLCAYIVQKAGCTITFDEIIGFLKEKNIATYKLPERVEFINQLPRGEQKGNVLKKQLKEDITNKLKAEGKIFSLA